MDVRVITDETDIRMNFGEYVEGIKIWSQCGIASFISRIAI